MGAPLVHFEIMGGEGHALEAGPEQPEHRDRALLELVVSVDAREPEQHVGEHRVAARRRMVVQVTPTGWTARCVEHGVLTSLSV